MPQSIFSRVMAIAVMLSLIASPLLQAQETAPSPQPPRSQVQDVILSPNGSLQGRLLDPQGKALDGAQVSLVQGEERLATVLTDRQGTFTMQGVTSGFYRLETPGQAVACRVWTEQTAPPSAQQAVTMVKSDSIVRGQYGVWTPGLVASLALGVTGVTLAGIAVSDINSVKSTVDKILDEVQSPN